MTTSSTPSSKRRTERPCAHPALRRAGRLSIARGRSDWPSEAGSLQAVSRRTKAGSSHGLPAFVRATGRQRHGGGGAGSRTRVRRRSTRASTCVVRSELRDDVPADAAAATLVTESSPRSGPPAPPRASRFYDAASREHRQAHGTAAPVRPQAARASALSFALVVSRRFCAVPGRRTRSLALARLRRNRFTPLSENHLQHRDCGVGEQGERTGGSGWASWRIGTGSSRSRRSPWCRLWHRSAFVSVRGEASARCFSGVSGRVPRIKGWGRVLRGPVDYRSAAFTKGRSSARWRPAASPSRRKEKKRAGSETVHPPTSSTCSTRSPARRS